MKRLQTILATITMLTMLTMVGCAQSMPIDNENNVTPVTPVTSVNSVNSVDNDVLVPKQPITLITPVQANYFTTTWKTEDKQIKLPLVENGEYDFIVDWGDGVENYVTKWDVNTVHDYNEAGEYIVKISGKLIGWSFGTKDQQPDELIHISHWGTMSFGDTKWQFQGCKNLTIETEDAPDLNNTISLTGVFYDASSLTGGVANWDVSNIENMSTAFYRAAVFNESLNTWDMSKVINAEYMFYGATAFNGDISNWDFYNLNSTAAMFSGATAFNGDISNWDMSKVKYTPWMFANTHSFNQDISEWDVSNVTEYYNMFHNATAMEEVNKPTFSF